MTKKLTFFAGMLSALTLSMCAVMAPVSFDSTAQLTAQAASTVIAIDEAHFPDSIFRSYILENIDLNGDGRLSINECAYTLSIDVGFSSIESLKGIEYFTNLQTLDCSKTKLTSLDVSNNPELIKLDCSSNNLTALDLSKNTELENLNCGVNPLAELDLSNNNALTELQCPYNGLKSLDLSSNPNLVSIICMENYDLTDLDFSHNPKLTYINVDYCFLENLDISKNTNLQYLSCHDNELNELDLSKNTELTALNCEGNNLSVLDLSNNKKITSLTYGKNIVIKNQPTDASAEYGKAVSTKVDAVGEGLKYQWYVKNPGQKSFVKSSVKTATYSYVMTPAKDGRQVYCIITDANGNKVRTNTVTLTMIKPAIIQQPQDVTVNKGEVATVTVEAIGDGLTYRWFYKNKNMSSFLETSSFKTKTYSVIMNEARADRQIFCIITDKYGNSVMSDVVTLNMN